MRNRNIFPQRALSERPYVIRGALPEKYQFAFQR